MLESGEQIRLLLHVSLALLPQKYRQTIGPNEVGRVDDAQLAVDVREDHVEMDRRRLLRHYDDDEIGDIRLLEQERSETVDPRGARPLTEPDQQNIFAQRMNVAALQCVVEPALDRPVVK